MYKLRFTKWEIMKNNRESDMAVIVRKKRARDAEGKKSTFLVNRKEVSVQEIDRYAKRRRTLDTTFAAALTDKPTPTHIICLTPPDSPSPEELQDTSIVLGQQNTFAAASAVTSNRLGKRRRVSSLSPIRPNSLVAQQGYRQIRACPQSPSLPYFVTTPDVLRRPEMLFADIWSYVQGSVSNGTWYLNKNGRVQGLHSRSAHAIDFANLCIEATGFFQIHSGAQGRRLLSKAFSLLGPLLTGEDPWLLQNLLSILIRLKQLGYVGICDIIQDYTAELARSILPEKPLWQRICISICYADPEHHTELLKRSWRSLTDAFADVPGVDARLTYMSVTNEADLTYRLHRWTEPERAEKLLREILADYEQKMQMMDDTALYVVARLADVLQVQRRYLDVELLVEDAFSRARQAGSSSTVRDGNLMKSLAWAQHRLLKDRLAEESMRNAMALYAEDYGANDPIVIRCSRILESWLREWGREAEADHMLAEIDKLIGPDDIDMDAAVPPHYSAKMATSQLPNPSFNNTI